MHYLHFPVPGGWILYEASFPLEPSQSDSQGFQDLMRNSTVTAATAQQTGVTSELTGHSVSSALDIGCRFVGRPRTREGVPYVRVVW